MTIQLWNFSTETSATHPWTCVHSVKGFTTKLFLGIFLDYVIYKLFRFETFYAYGILILIIFVVMCMKSIYPFRIIIVILNNSKVFLHMLLPRTYNSAHDFLNSRFLLVNFMIILTAGNNTKKGCPVSVHIKMHLTKHYPSKMHW